MRKTTETRRADVTLCRKCKSRISDPFREMITLRSAVCSGAYIYIYMNAILKSRECTEVSLGFPDYRYDAVKARCREWTQRILGIARAISFHRKSIAARRAVPCFVPGNSRELQGEM